MSLHSLCQAKMSFATKLHSRLKGKLALIFGLETSAQGSVWLFRLCTSLAVLCHDIFMFVRWCLLWIYSESDDTINEFQITLEAKAPKGRLDSLVSISLLANHHSCVPAAIQAKSKWNDYETNSSNNNLCNQPPFSMYGSYTCHTACRQVFNVKTYCYSWAIFQVGYGHIPYMSIYADVYGISPVVVYYFRRETVTGTTLVPNLTSRYLQRPLVNIYV